MTVVDSSGKGGGHVGEGSRGRGNGKAINVIEQIMLHKLSNAKETVPKGSGANR